MRIYIDTSVISALHSNEERMKEITEQFFRSAKFWHLTLYGSDVVVIEIMNTPNTKKRKLFAEVIDEYSIEILPITDEIRKLAQYYVANKIIPGKYLADALHISCAVVHNIPILVSWNFAHIIRHKTRIEVNRINQKFSWPQIDLCSPQEV